MNKAKEFIKSKKGKIIIAASAAILVVIIVAIVLLLSKKEDKEAYRTISVSALSGTVMAENNGSEYKAYEDMKLHEGYALRTESDSFARLILDNDKYIKLEENSKATFEKLGKDKTGYTTINLQYGAITNEITEPLSEDDEYMIHTPNAVFAVRGTFFRVEVAENESGEILTDVYAYGGTVASKRITPEGEVVEENVLVEGGYKATISMDTSETIYLTESIEEGKENVEPITLAEIPEADIVDMYVASVNGHEMFVGTEDIWYSIETRGIDVNDYTSNRDESKIPVYDKDINHTHNEKTTETEATCTKNGQKKTVCVVCGEVLEDTVKEAIGHKEVETSKEATCTEEGYTRVECEACKQILLESVIEAIGHTEETVIVQPTEDTPGKTTVSCSVCGDVINEVEIPINHTHTEETVEVAATCTKAGSKVTRCSVCLEQFSKTEIPALGHGKKDEKVVSAATCSKEGTKEIKCTVCGQVTGNESIPKLKHTEVEESIEATFAAAGSYKKSCSVCKTVLETKSISKLPAIYTDEGDIFITSSGYYTSSDMTHVPYTGDYVISQKSSSRVSCSIYIEGGEHNVTLDGINITGCFDVSAEADVSLYGTTKANYITSENGVAAINNSASLDICSGNITAKSTSYGLKNYENACISGGNLTFEGGTADVNAGSLYILGGSVKLVNDTMSGTAYNGSTKLECFVYNAYPLDYQLKYPLKNGDISYVSVGKTDVNADGKFYIWKSAEDLVISEKTFPDANIRTYINNNFDSDYNGYLSDTEIENATQLIMYNAVSSFEGVQYLTGLEILQCYGDITATKIEMRTLTNLQKLDLTNAPISNIELYNCVDLMELNLSGTRISYLDLNPNRNLTLINLSRTDIYQLDLSSCDKLERLYIDATQISGLDLMWQRDTLKELSCADTQITYLDLGWCSKLESLNIRNCPLACINLVDTLVDENSFQTTDNIYKYWMGTETSIAVRNIIGLDASKIYSVTGADFDAATGTFTNITGTRIDYKYDCGNGVASTFTIQISY